MRLSRVPTTCLTLSSTMAAGWQSVYSANFSDAFIQSTDGTLYHLPIETNQESQADVTANLKEIARAPGNSSLVLDADGHLLAVWGSSTCGSAPLEISEYDSQHNQWVSVAQSDMKSQLWHQENQIVWVDRSEDCIYIYGGTCEKKTQSGFYKYDLQNSKFSSVDVSGGVMPRKMSNAQAIPLNNFQTLIIGGKAENAWMSMQQIALWGYGSWTFSPVSNSSGIDSRENPLVLPVFEYNQNGTNSIVEKIIVIGGTVAGRQAEPSICVLKHSETDGWYWDHNSTGSNQQTLPLVTYAGTTLYSTLATMNGSANGVELFGQTEESAWHPVSYVSVNKKLGAGSSSHKGGSSTAVIAIVSTLLPIIVIALTGGAFWWWWRRRRERRLFLLPNRMNMLKRQPTTESGRSNVDDQWTTPNWHSNEWNATQWGTDHWSPAPRHQTASMPNLTENEKSSRQASHEDDGSIHMVGSKNGEHLFMSRQRRSLHVVNPDGFGSREIYDSDVRQSSPQRASSSEIDQKKYHLSREAGLSRRSSAEDHTSENEPESRSRASSWSSGHVGPFSDRAEVRSEFDFGV